MHVYSSLPLTGSTVTITEILTIWMVLLLLCFFLTKREAVLESVDFVEVQVTRGQC